MMFQWCCFRVVLLSFFNSTFSWPRGPYCHCDMTSLCANGCTLCHMRCFCPPISCTVLPYCNHYKCVCIHPSFALLYLCTCKLNFSIWYPSLVEAAARSGDQGNHLMMYEPRKTLSTCAIVCVCAWVYF